LVTPNVGIVRKIVFLVCWPITKFDVERWGFEYLSSKGLEVEVYDLSPFLNHKALKINPVRSAITADYIYKISSYEEFDRKIKSVASCSVLIDYIMGLSEPDLKTEKIYRILQKHHARYFVIAAGALPLTNTTGFWTNFLKNIKKALNNPGKLLNYAVIRLIVLVKKITSLYALPERIFGGNSEVVAAYLRRYGINADKVIPIHSLDHDTYLNFIKKTGRHNDQADKTCVFLDEALTHHSDFALFDIKPLTDERYFPSMNRLFDLIEKKTGLKVVIAAHPRSKYENMPGVFGNREIIKRKTVELVSKCSMVLMHTSTAVSFAVLFNKPIMVIKTSEMIEHNHFSYLLDTMINSLGVPAVNIDDLDEINTLPFDFDNWPKDKYNDYIYRYVKSKDLEDLTVWEVVAREVDKGNSDLNRELVT
jgi:hypothetical protein